MTQPQTLYQFLSLLLPFTCLAEAFFLLGLDDLWWSKKKSVTSEQKAPLSAENWVKAIAMLILFAISKYGITGMYAEMTQQEMSFRLLFSGFIPGLISGLGILAIYRQLLYNRNCWRKAEVIVFLITLGLTAAGFYILWNRIGIQ